MASLTWHDWDDQTFSKAVAEEKPILLLLTTSWCRFCKELRETTFADPEVVHEVTAGFVPVHVDSERRPDLNQRYNMGGWPTLAFLTPRGDLIAGETWQTAAQLLPLLRRVRAFHRDHRHDIETGLREMWARQERTDAGREIGHLSHTIVQDVLRAMVEKFDQRHGGWGEGQKFAHPDALDFAMVVMSQTGDDTLRGMVELTLDRMQEGGIHDRIDGGFFRFSTTRDWSVPNHEKVLETNAGLLRCYLEGYQLFGKKEYRDAAQGIVNWLLRFMRDPDTGAFCGSQDADRDYYVGDAERRARRAPPRRDPTLYTNWNAMVASSLFKARVVLDTFELRTIAMEVIEFLTRNLYFKGGGMYHYWDGTYHLPGILSDQAYMVRALVDAAQFSGDQDYLLTAEDVAETLIKKQRAQSGGFYDIPYDPRSQGSLQRRNKSILENAVIAEAVTRLAYLSRRDEFMQVARSTLEAFAGHYREYGYYVAGYARAVDLLLYEPITVTVVGDRSSNAGRALRRAAQSIYVPSRIVQALDPQFDPILLKRSGYPVGSRPVAYICVGKTTKAMVEDPDQVVKTIEDIERARRKKT